MTLGAGVGPRGKGAPGHDAVHRQVRCTAVGRLPPPATGSSNQRGRVSNRDFPAPYRSKPGGYGRRAGGRSPGGQHSSRSSRAGLRRGGAEASSGGGRSGVGGDVYEPRRAAPGRSGGGSRDSWDEPGTTWGRSAARFGTGVRDIRDDLRERLRRNGVRGDWDTADAPPRRRRTDGGDRGGPDGPDGGKGRKGRWWRHWTWKKALTLVAALIGGVVMLAA